MVTGCAMALNQAQEGGNVVKPISIVDDELCHSR